MFAFFIKLLSFASNYSAKLVENLKVEGTESIFALLKSLGLYADAAADAAIQFQGHNT
jgi:hypothetical protein